MYLSFATTVGAARLMRGVKSFMRQGLVKQFIVINNAVTHIGHRVNDSLLSSRILGITAHLYLLSGVDKVILVSLTLHLHFHFIFIYLVRYVLCLFSVL